MTRVMVWNIDQFDITKLQAIGFNDDPIYGVKPFEMSLGHQSYISSNLMPIHPGGIAIAPDILVILEVSTLHQPQNNIPGLLDDGLGGQGATDLLDIIRGATGNNHWMLVPPLQTGVSDSVAVYYDSTHLAFAGPRIWPGAQGPAVDPNQIPAPATAAYPGMFAGVLPNRQVPATLPNAGAQEDICAANTTFHVAPGYPNAGNVVNFGNNRTPYQVSFGELDGTGTVIRQIDLFAVHGPANKGRARTFIQQLSQLAEVAVAPTANQVKVVLGDFNLNLTENIQNAAQHQLQQEASYVNLTGLGYQMALTVPAPVPYDPTDPQTFSGYTGYFATHMRTLAQATYWYVSNTADFYPGYGIIGSGSSSVRDYSYDNILVRFGMTAGGPMGEVSVMNGIVPQPFAQVNPPPHNAPAGFYTWPVQMADQRYANPPDRIIDQTRNEASDQAILRQWNNYGRIISTSDHMALIATI
ncbi:MULTISPECIES: hypothetical protein [Halomonadaceae]|jgi:hypothetical protein|uniref:Uncharacterized protein n=1 Tax=Vreelandella titanicae TaxID=664683 RepID=A0A653XRL9_9GAMM|nr:MULTISPECIES: hypothetical protein [Halomonas]UEQ03433.1 hypothetical protein LMS44_19480 [Halomonas profundus]QKS25399.1 hypothetical protein FX987_03195 [Halomonas titanicae]TMU28747.1 hypothetical protein E0L35_01095 [Halomonas sp. ATBC28]CAD5258026.1 conserved hypothetical protein [Halomonas sp. 59]CAD5258249.1 conserved hypothetical protein [Halomonas sp. 113]